MFAAVAVGLAAAAAWVWGAQAREGIDFCVKTLGAAGPGPFFGAMAVAPMFGFPLSAFTLAAGPVFGPSLGAGTVVSCAALAIAVNVALSYWVAARALRPLTGRLLKWSGLALPELPEGAAWEVALLVRIVPGTPFFLQSYALGLARVPFGVYMAASTLVPAVYAAGTILAGAALMRRDPRMLAGAAVMLVAVSAALHILRKRLQTARRARRAANSAQVDAPEGGAGSSAGGETAGRPL